MLGQPRTSDSFVCHAALLVGLGIAATLALGCGATVTGGGGGAGGESETSTVTTTGDTTSNTTVTGTHPASTCGGQPGGGVCGSTGYPGGESCGDCSCRCCEDNAIEVGCWDDAACATWLDCMRDCQFGEPCAQQCVLPCATGNEPACYLMDCHNWVCPHACGTSG